MPDGDHDSFHDGAPSESRVLVATTLATLIFAGSAFALRSSLRNYLPLVGFQLGRQHRHSDDGDGSKADDLAARQKSSRSKERRRRGKDPLKELMKGGKKAKALAKLVRHAEDTTTRTSFLETAVSTFVEHSRDPSISTSSRSVSSASSSHSNAYMGSEAGLHDLSGDNDVEDTVPGMPPLPDVLELLDDDQEPIESQAGPSDLNRSRGTIPVGSSLPNQTRSPVSASLTSDNTVSPHQEHETIESHRSYSAYPFLQDSSSTSRQQSLTDPWAWDGIKPPKEVKNPKPPRFRAKSQGKPPAQSSTPASTSASSLTTSNAEPSTSSSSNDSFDSNDTDVPSLSPDSSATNDTDSVGALHTPRRITTPRRTPTPSSNGSTPPPSLSQQTQIAGLRGALEAARLREEKMKTEIEKFTKEVEALRWQGESWRRREMELQTQVHHLAYQLQSYASIFTGTPHLHAQSAMGQHLQVPNQNSSSPASPNGYPLSLPPSPNTQNTPAIHMLAMNGMLSPTGILSPMQMASPHSPYFNYPQQTHAQAPLSLPGLYPMPPPFSQVIDGSGGQSSPSGKSSSPDTNSSPIPPASFDRGRRRTRNNKQTVDMSIGINSSQHQPIVDLSESWVGTVHGDEEEYVDVAGDNDDDGDASDDEDNGFSEVLADAILKDPGSIRLGSKKRSREKKQQQKGAALNLNTDQPMEFVFPSLTDMGAYRERGYLGKPGERRNSSQTTHVNAQAPTATNTNVDETPVTSTSTESTPNPPSTGDQDLQIGNSNSIGQDTSSNAQQVDPEAEIAR